MRAIKNFEAFVKEGIVKMQASDKSRSEFLMKETEQSYNSLLENLEKIKVANSNANSYIKQCHDIIMELIRAKMLIRGYNASGFGAHESEVSYLRILGYNEKDIQFADQIRYFRNGMLYCGTMLDKEFADKVIEFTKKIYLKLRKQ